MIFIRKVLARYQDGSAERIIIRQHFEPNADNA